MTMRKAEFVVIHVDVNSVAFLELRGENLNCQWILNQSLYGALERSSAVDRIIAFFGEQGFGRLGDLQGHLAVGQIVPQALELNIDDRLDLFATEAAENNCLVDPIQKFRPEGFAQGIVR